MQVLIAQNRHPKKSRKRNVPETERYRSRTASPPSKYAAEKSPPANHVLDARRPEQEQIKHVA